MFLMIGYDSFSFIWTLDTIHFHLFGHWRNFKPSFLYRNKEKVILNEQTGYLLRTKASDSDEGGVAAGYAFLDSVYLI
jgi:hypothetical protein